MMMNGLVTRFSEMTRKEASLILLSVVLLIMYGLISLTQAFPPRERSETDGEDARMYQSIIDRVRGGESYYTVVGDELRTRGYASRPFFNWRLPTMAWMMSQLPKSEWGRWILVTLAFVTMILWIQVLDREVGFPFAAAGGLLLCGPIFLCLSGTGFYYHELWAGMMIALSLAAYARGYKGVGIVAGIFSLFIRELALPYVVIMFVMAWREKRTSEALGWLGGLTAFSLVLLYHGYFVSGLLTSMDQSNDSWIQFGGWPFVMSTGIWNAFLLIVPKWVVAVVLPLAIMGLFGWRGSVGLRVAGTVGIYCCAYLIAGRPDNSYWGLIYAPLVPLGLLYTIPSLLDLWRKVAKECEA